MIVNDKYKEQYEQLHADYKFKGGQVAVFKKEIGRFIKDIKALNVLDYGCGAASAYKKKLHEKWRVPLPFLYDPYRPEYAERPPFNFDLVICTDVMEHIPEEDVQDVLDDIFDHADKGVFLTIAQFPAKKTLPNGENAHCTLESSEWWNERIERANKKGVDVKVIFRG